MVQPEPSRFTWIRSPLEALPNSILPRIRYSVFLSFALSKSLATLPTDRTAAQLPYCSSSCFCFTITSSNAWRNCGSVMLFSVSMCAPVYSPSLSYVLAYLTGYRRRTFSAHSAQIFWLSFNKTNLGISSLTDCLMSPHNEPVDFSDTLPPQMGQTSCSLRFSLAAFCLSALLIRADSSFKVILSRSLSVSPYFSSSLNLLKQSSQIYPSLTSMVMNFGILPPQMGQTSGFLALAALSAASSPFLASTAALMGAI